MSLCWKGEHDWTKIYGLERFEGRKGGKEMMAWDGCMIV